MSKPNKERVSKWVHKWKDHLLLDKWSVLIDYAENDYQTGSTDVRLADITVSLRYCDARMNIYPAFWTKPKVMQEVTIIHELCHILTAASKEAMLCRTRPSERRTIDLNEELTESIAKLAFKRHSKRKPDMEYTL